MNKKIFAALISWPLVYHFSINACEAKNNNAVVKIKKQGAHRIDKKKYYKLQGQCGHEKSHLFSEKHEIDIAAIEAMKKQLNIMKKKFKYSLESVDMRNSKEKWISNNGARASKEDSRELNSKQNLGFHDKKLREYLIVLCNRLVPQLFGLLASFNTALEPYDKNAKIRKTLFDIKKRKGFRELLQKISVGKGDIGLRWQDIENQTHQISMFMRNVGGNIKDDSKISDRKYKKDYIYNTIKTTIQRAEVYIEQLDKTAKKLLRHCGNKTRGRKIYTKIGTLLKKITICFSPYAMNMCEYTEIKNQDENVICNGIDENMAESSEKIAKEAEKRHIEKREKEKQSNKEIETTVDYNKNERNNVLSDKRYKKVIREEIIDFSDTSAG